MFGIDSRAIWKFVIGMVIFLGIFQYVAKPYIVKWWLGAWTVKKNEIVSVDLLKYSNISDISVDTLFLNLKLWHGMVYSFQSLGKSIKIYHESVNLINTDIVELIDGAVNKRAVLKTHIKQLEDTSDKLWEYIIWLNEFGQENKTMYAEFSQEKRMWDESFFSGIGQNDAEEITVWVSQSYNNWPKATWHKILYSASIVINNKLRFIKQIVDSKHTILTDNQDLIIDNFSVIQDDIAEKIVRLKNMLKRYKVSK